jgi:hypothetical protein
MPVRDLLEETRCVEEDEKEAYSSAEGIRLIDAVRVCIILKFGFRFTLVANFVRSDAFVDDHVLSQSSRGSPFG